MFLGMFMDMENTVSLLETARLYQLSRLERQCVEYMADNIDGVSLRGNKTS